MPENRALSLTKNQSQATPYLWIWRTRDTRTVVLKYIDTEALRKINAHEGSLSAAGRPIHG